MKKRITLDLNLSSFMVLGLDACDACLLRATHQHTHTHTHTKRGYSPSVTAIRAATVFINFMRLVRGNTFCMVY